MKRKYWITALVVVVVLAGAALVFGQAQRHHHGWGPGMMGRGFMGHMARTLNLTDAQKTQIKSMWDAEKPTAMPLIQQLANGHKEMLAATANGNFDQAKVQQIAQQQSQTITQLIVEKEKLQARIYSQVLTPEQRLKVDQMRQTQSTKIDEWMQHLTQGGQTPGK